MKYKINTASLNVRGLGDDNKRRTVFDWLRKYHKQEIILLQETHSSHETEKKWIKEWGSDIYFSHGTTASKGVAILFPNNNSEEYKILQNIGDTEGRILILTIETSTCKFVIGNIYAPTKDHLEDQKCFLKTLRDKLLVYLGENIIIGGDFNVVRDSLKDKIGGLTERPTEYLEQLLSLEEEFGLSDVWRRLNPEKIMWTRRQRSPPVFTRLDFWLLSEHLTSAVNKCNILPAIKTDHSLINLELCGNAYKRRGPGTWKFNAALLQDLEYVQSLNELIIELSNKYENLEDKNLKWDTIKCEIRGFTVRYSKIKRRKSREKETLLRKQEIELMNNVKTSEEFVVELERVKKELENISDEYSRGIYLRSQAQWCEDGEKNTKYFLSLEKKNYNNKVLTKLITEKGTEITVEDEILTEEQDYYKKLYTSRRQQDDDLEHSSILQGLAVPSLEEEERKNCDRSIDLNECHTALKDMKNGKSPGSDGYTVEFYKFFWTKIGNLVLDSYNYSFKEGRLSIDQRRGVISLLPKKDKNRELLKNWRPLTLLNVDYKILAKILAARVRSSLPKLIEADQCGYIKNRYIGENIRTINDVIHLSRAKKQTGILLMIDFEKAFDTLEWDFLLLVLKRFNFGNMFIKWIQLLYTDITSCVTNNGYLSRFFKLNRGVRQGCPLSPFLFILAVEIMAISIRSNKNITGLIFNDKELKLLQLADDTTCFVADGRSARTLMIFFDDFQGVSGLKVNLDKTEGVWLGPPRNDMEGPIPIRWTKEFKFKTLGIHFSDNETNSCEDNVQLKIQEIKKLFNIWNSRDLSIIGRVLIAKSLASSKILYAVSCTIVTDEVLSEVQQIIWQFVWNNKPPKVKRTVMCQKPGEGGLKVVHLLSQAKSLRIMWMKRLWVSENNTSWTQTLQLMIPFIIRTDLCLSRGDFSNHVSALSGFYKLMLRDWCDLKRLKKPCTTEEIRKEFIWFNNFIVINGKSAFWKHWYDKGIRFINDIVDQEGNFLLQDQLISKYGINTNFLECLQLRSAIPYEWKRLLRNYCDSVVSESIEAVVEVHGREIPLRTITCKDIYWTLIDSFKEAPTAQTKWLDFHPEIQPTDWRNIYLVSFSCTLETKLQAFSFKILHRIVQHNELLKKMGIEESPECPFCEESESIEHKFYRCQRSLTFWDSFCTWWNHSFVNIDLTELEVLFGLFELPQNNCLNYMILLGKHYIQLQYSTQQSLLFNSFLVLAESKMKLLKFISINRNNSLFDATWETLLRVLTNNS